MNSIIRCQVCREPAHNGRCVDILVAALREAREQLAARQVPIVGETSPEVDRIHGGGGGGTPLSSRTLTVKR